MSSILQQILKSFPKSDCVRIRDPARLEKILNQLIQRGPESLQVITDFDATLSRYHQNGRRCESSYGLLSASPLVPAEYKKLACSLREKYYPIELDPCMSLEEKTAHMIEWYDSKHQKLVGISPPFKKSYISQMVGPDNPGLRDNVKDMLEMLLEAHVPVLVLSAGLGDVIEEILNVHQVNFSNVQVISNFMEFNEKEELVGFKKPLIHMCNKNEAVVHDFHFQYFEDLKHRNNALVLGDHKGDAYMAHGISNPDAILKIGFLNSEVEKLLDSFMKSFDIVLLDDQSMDFVNLLLAKILKKDQIF